MLNFITTGCSFTAGIIPLPHNSAELWQRQGSVWPHFIFAKMNPCEDVFTNLALPGGGNIAAFTNLIYYLESNKDKITPSNSIIGFNVTEPGRLDIIDSVDSININTDQCCIDTTGMKHISAELGFGWITHGLKSKQSNSEILGYLSVIQALAYLDQRKFRYFFMIMSDSIYTDAPKWFQQSLNNHQNNWITFSSSISMLTMIKTQQLTVSKTDLHPSTAGHIKIAEQVDLFLKKNLWYE